MSRGLWLGIGAYTIWGLFPIYWKLVERVPAAQIVAHRIAWSFLVLAACIAVSLSPRWRRAGGGSIGFAGSPGTVAIYAIAGVLIGVNWFIYVWAVNHAFVVETSLGYFITPLVNVLLGVTVLRERLRRGQWLAVLVAAIGVAYLTFIYGAVPWIAIGLAVSFGSYGLVKKRAPLAPMSGLTLETGLLFVPAVAFLVAAEGRGTGAFGHVGVLPTVLLAGAGLVTTVPLVMFAGAVQRVPLSVMGILQFIAPTIQFLLGVFAYHERFSQQQLIGFSLVWAALAIFAADGLLAARRG